MKGLIWHSGADLLSLRDLVGLDRVDVLFKMGTLGLKDAAQVAFAAEIAGKLYALHYEGEPPEEGWAGECWRYLEEGERYG